MNYTNDFLEREAMRVINLLKTDFLMSDGSLCLEKVGESKRPNHIFPDMGDFLPFFIYFGEKDFVEKQIKIFQSLQQDGFWISEHSTWWFKNLVKSYEYTDLLYGLLSFYGFKKDSFSQTLLESNVQHAITAFNLCGRPSSFYLPKQKKHFPVLDSRDGMFIELFVDLSDLTGENEYLEIAQNLFKWLIKNDFYERYSIFPKFSVFGLMGVTAKVLKPEHFNQAEIMKYTTNCLHAFSALYRKTGKEEIYKEITKIISSLKKYVINSGGVAKFFIPNQPAGEAFLGSSFSLLDFLCDFYYYFGREEDLILAQEIADFWLVKQGQTGLFPLFASQNYSFIDFETDMSVALSKLFELTNKKIYQTAVEKCLDGIFKHHATKNYILEVDINNGKIINQGQRTKFISLFLKLIILELEKFKGKKIYSNNQLLNLIEDR